MELNKNLQNALNTYADNIAIEVENHSLTYTELKNQSLRLLAFLKADKMGFVIFFKFNNTIRIRIN